MNALPHPDVPHLTAYLLGKLSWAELEKVEIHLDGCLECRSRVGDLEGSADSFVSRLRGATPQPAEDMAMAKLLAGARALTQPTVSFVAPPAPKMSAGL
jgi:anti-sigma factor RsiW